MEIEKFKRVGNIKFRTNYRESMYWKLRDTDFSRLESSTAKKDEGGVFSSLNDIFSTAFAIGYHFDKQLPVTRMGKLTPVNHVNLVSFVDNRSEVADLMVILILKRKPEITNPKILWAEVEKYAEYGIKVLFNSIQDKKNILEIDDIIEKV